VRPGSSSDPPPPRWSRLSDVGLLTKILAAFLVVLVTASLVTVLLETRLTRAQVSDQARTLLGELGETFDLGLEADAVRVNRLMETVLQGQYGGLATDVVATDLTVDLADGAGVERARRTLATLRRATSLELGGIVDVPSGSFVLGLTARDQMQDPGPEDAREVARRSGASQRVVELRDGGYAVAHVLPVGRTAERPALLVIGYALNDRWARQVKDRTGANDVEIVAGERVIASTTDRVGGLSLGQPAEPRRTQRLEDGRLLRYVAIGAPDRPWDTPAVVGLVFDDPLGALDNRLAQTRVLMGILMVLVGGLLAWALARVMTRPITRLTTTATAIAGGDLERPFDIDRRDEIGRLADALERMRRALRAQLLVIRQQAEALQLAARRVVAVQDDERQRIAQDLHDGIQQQLVVLRMQVGVARTQLEQDPSRTEEVTAPLAASIDQLLADLRATGQALFPSILTDRGLGGALFSLAGRTPLPLDLVLEPDPLPRFGRDVETNAYFLVTEAVTNALKHADADRIDIRATREAGQLRLVVRDDGLGFDPTAVSHRGGLVHMRDRVSALGGTLRIVSAVGEGTTVSALIPVDEASVGGALEVEQDGGDASVELELLGEAELPEDGVGVLLDGALRDGQVAGDRRVPPA
jgi:signal transduction histidine kinase